MLTDMLPAFIATIFAASLVQGATGFGFALVAVSVLSLLTPLTHATPLLALLNVPVSTYLLLKLRRSIEWPELVGLLVGVGVGVPFGVHVLVNWPQEVLLRILAVVLFLAVARSLTRKQEDPVDAVESASEKPAALKAATSLGAGWAAGALGGAFGTSGPPLIAYVYCRPWSKEQRTGSLQALFLLCNVCAISLFAANGLYTRDLFITAAACLPATLVGALAGFALFRRLPRRGLEVFVAVFLTFVGIKLLIWA